MGSSEAATSLEPPKAGPEYALPAGLAADSNATPKWTRPESSMRRQDRRVRADPLTSGLVPSETAVRERQKSAPCSQHKRLGLCRSRLSDRTVSCAPDWKAALSWRLARLPRAPSHGKIPTSLINRAEYPPSVSRFTFSTDPLPLSTVSGRIRRPPGANASSQIRTG
jgi:hypothetical protein